MKNLSKTAAAVCSFALSLTLVTSPSIAAVHIPIRNPMTFDPHGTVSFKEDALMDLIIPETIHGVTVETIGAYAFANCAFIRTVTIPATVTAIGEGAFASCPYLESIVLTDRIGTEDLHVGANWAGDAQVIFDSDKEVQAQVDAFNAILAEIQAVKVVDVNNLEEAKAALQVLDSAYAELCDEAQEHTGTAYQKIRRVLSGMIQEAEAIKQFMTEPAKPEEEAPVVSSEDNLFEPPAESIPDTIPAETEPEPMLDAENISEDIDQQSPVE